MGKADLQDAVHVPTGININRTRLHDCRTEGPILGISALSLLVHLDAAEAEEACIQGEQCR